MLFTNREEIFLKLFKKAVPLISIVFALAIELILKNNDKQPAANRPYFTYFLVVVFAVIALLFVLSFANKKIDEKLSYKGKFWAGVILFLNIYNILTLKLAALPILYFPSLHRIFGVLFEDYAFLGKCLLYSLRLLLSGWFGGAIIGVATGICIGFNSKFRYWIQPIVKSSRPYTFNGMDTACTYKLPYSGFRQCISYRSCSMVPYNSAYKQRYSKC